ncbi:flagellar hook-associated protein FlgK [Zavarzinia sp. CC-PAN008]|uniref:flagellar hook-associated protein FlgK n=1 Tax=Zavarzinia sp. CC-PAN008 TaxID=3243332 RepID=UPI003F743144
MSLNGILSNANSGLAAAQSQLRNISNNVANVNTVGYARKVVDQSTQVLGTQSSGVTTQEARRVADKFLDAQTMLATGDAARWDAVSTFQQQVQAMLGKPESNTSLSGRLDTLYAAFNAAQADPSSAALKAQIVTALAGYTRELSTLTQSVNDLRAEADLQVAAKVGEANEQLKRIHQLNLEISKAQATGGDGAASLADQRQAALDKLAGLIDIKVQEQSNGALHVSTTNGLQLVGSLAYQLDYTANGSPTSATRFPQIMVRALDPSGNPLTAGQALDSNLQGGALRGLLDVRDQVLPGIAESLGQLAQATDAMNAVANQNTAYPAPATLTGRNTGLDGNDALNTTGDVTFSVVAADGTVTSTVTVSVTPGMTINGLVAAANGGLAGGSLSFANGVLQVQATGGGGVVVSEDLASATTRAGRGFSHFFGLNDLVRANVPLSGDTGLTAADAHRFTGTTTLELRGPNGSVAASQLVDFGAIGGTVADVLNALNTGFAGYASFALDAQGALTMTPAPGMTGLTLGTRADSSARGTTGMNFSAFFSVGQAGTVEAARTLDVAPDLKAASNRVPLGRFDTTRVPPISASDASGAQALQAMADTVLAFAAVGPVPAGTMSLSQYATSVLTAAGTAASEVSSRLADATAVKTEVTARQQGVSGVNLDEELSNMIIYQNAYNASARMIATARDMYDTLLSLVQ